MAAKVWKQISPLKYLFEKPQIFDFFQAVKILETSCKTDFTIDSDQIRFHTSIKTNFTVGKISQIEISQNFPDTLYPVYHVIVNFMGLTGSVGVLPPYFQELVVESSRHGERAWESFFNIFNNKILSLLYKVWKKNNLSSLSMNSSKNLYSTILGSLSGIGIDSLQNKQLIPDEFIHYYANLFSRRVHSAKSLQGILCEYLHLPIKILEFEPHWLYLQPADRTIIGNIKKSNSRWNSLGKNIVLGHRYLSVQSKFRIWIGPLNYKQYNSLIPGGNLIKAICEVIRLFVRYELTFDFKIELLASEAPTCPLSCKKAIRLGWNSWLFSKPPISNIFSISSIH